MNKAVLYLTLGIIALVLAADLAWRGYLAYAANRAMSDFAHEIKELGENERSRQQAARTAKQRAEAEANTLCALNNDTQKCVCRDKRMGQALSVSHDQCVARASR